MTDNAVGVVLLCDAPFLLPCPPVGVEQADKDDGDDRGSDAAKEQPIHQAAPASCWSKMKLVSALIGWTFPPTEYELSNRSVLRGEWTSWGKDCRHSLRKCLNTKFETGECTSAWMGCASLCRSMCSRLVAPWEQKRLPSGDLSALGWGKSSLFRIEPRAVMPRLSERGR